MAFIFLIRTEQELGPEVGMLGCWKLDVPEGEDWGTVATEFATEQGFPVGAIATLVNPGGATVLEAIQSFKLEQTWVPYSG